MNMDFYYDLYVSEYLQEKKDRIIKKLKANKLQPNIYVITLSQGSQNHLEFFQSILLKQHVFDHTDLFVVGLADGYDDALQLVAQITESVYESTGKADIRAELLKRHWQNKAPER